MKNILLILIIAAFNSNAYSDDLSAKTLTGLEDQDRIYISWNSLKSLRLNGDTSFLGTYFFKISLCAKYRPDLGADAPKTRCSDTKFGSKKNIKDGQYVQLLNEKNSKITNYSETHENEKFKQTVYSFNAGELHRIAKEEVLVTTKPEYFLRINMFEYDWMDLSDEAGKMDIVLKSLEKIKNEDMFRGVVGQDGPRVESYFSYWIKK